MNRAAAGAGFLLFTLACAVGACVGDDPVTAKEERQPDPNIPAGHEGGACTADKKCIQGLECVRGVICLPPEDGGASTSDGGGSDTSTSDSGSSDGGESTCPFSGPVTSKVSCEAEVCTGSQRCCLGSSGTAICKDSCSGGEKWAKCDATGQCSSNVCCLRLTSPLGNTSSCPVVVPLSQFNETDCSPCTESTKEHRVCRNNSDCTGPATCHKLEVTNDTTKIPIGICL